MTQCSSTPRFSTLFLAAPAFQGSGIPSEPGNPQLDDAVPAPQPGAADAIPLSWAALRGAQHCRNNLQIMEGDIGLARPYCVNILKLCVRHSPCISGGRFRRRLDRVEAILAD